MLNTDMEYEEEFLPEVPLKSVEWFCRACFMLGVRGTRCELLRSSALVVAQQERSRQPVPPSQKSNFVESDFEDYRQSALLLRALAWSWMGLRAHKLT